MNIPCAYGRIEIFLPHYGMFVGNDQSNVALQNLQSKFLSAGLS